MRTLAISNYKSGIGKTTTAVSLVSIYASRGKRMLLVDFDPQASATDYFGLYDVVNRDSANTTGLLYSSLPIEQVAHDTGIEHLRYIPVIIDLIGQNACTARAA